MFKTVVKLDAKIFNDAERRRVLSNIVSKNTKEFREATKRGITTGSRSGKTYQRGRGRGFRYDHKASARGETIADDSGNTVRNTTSRNVSDFHSVVEVDTDYAERLLKMDRKIFPSIDEAQIKFTNEVNASLKNLL